MEEEEAVEKEEDDGGDEDEEAAEEVEEEEEDGDDFLLCAAQSAKLVQERQLYPAVREISSKQMGTYGLLSAPRTTPVGMRRGGGGFFVWMASLSGLLEVGEREVWVKNLSIGMEEVEKERKGKKSMLQCAEVKSEFTEFGVLNLYEDVGLVSTCRLENSTSSLQAGK